LAQVRPLNTPLCPARPARAAQMIQFERYPVNFFKRLVLNGHFTHVIKQAVRAMRFDPLKRTENRTKPDLLHGDGFRALTVAASLAGTFLLVFFMTTAAHHSEVAGNSHWRGARTAASGTAQPLQPMLEDKAAHRLGSILFVPWSAKLCEERWFDNFTGAIVSADTIDCDARLASETAPAPSFKFGRMQGIFDSFKK
jgi:hypothetical protein